MRSSPARTALGGLTNGGTYWIIQDGGYAVQLASSYANALADKPITLTPDTSSAGEAVTHELVPAPIGGLTSGLVYYVRNATAKTFQLSATPTGPIISLSVDSPADIKGDAQLPPGRHPVQQLLERHAGPVHRLHAAIRPATTSCWARAASRCAPSRRRRATAFPRRRPTAARVVSRPPASPNARPTSTANVQAYVAAQHLTVGGNLSITTNSTANTSSQANNAGGGFVLRRQTRTPAPASRITIRRSSAS